MSSRLKGVLQLFANAELSADERLKYGSEICDILENATGDDDLKETFPALINLIHGFLCGTDVQFIKEAPLQRLRHKHLEIIQKIRTAEFFRPHVPVILSLLFKLVEQENEENVLLCVKIIIDLYKIYRPHFSQDVSNFLTFVQRVYRTLKGQVVNIFKPQKRYEFSTMGDVNMESLLSTVFTSTPIFIRDVKTDGAQTAYHILPKSCFSLKVMQEIPILVVLMYQLFKQQIHANVAEFIPLIMDFINMRPLPEQSRDPNFKQDKFIDFLAAQVKTLSFLAYVIKIYQDLVEQHSAALVKGMMNLLVTCPPSVTNMRKEFFIATRHILGAQEIRPKFLPVLDELMNEDTLIGQGYTVRDVLRPLAYSTLADLTHHLRTELNLTKMARATDMFGRNLFDDTLPFSIQQMSLRLLLNLAECIRGRISHNEPTEAVAASSETATTTTTTPATAAKKPPFNAAAARRLLLQIMRLVVLKCQLVAEHYLPELEARCIREDGDVDQKSMVVDGDDADVTNTHFAADPSLTQGHLTFTDLRSLTKALASGMRSVVASLILCQQWSLSGADLDPLSLSASTPPNQPPMNPQEKRSLAGCTAATPPPKHLLPAEMSVLSDYLTHGLRMIDVLRIISKDGQLYLRGAQSGAKFPDERLLLETIAMTFVPLSSASFREIFAAKIGYIVDWCRKSPLFYAHFAFHLLSQPSQTSNFGHILLTYLVDRLDKLGEGTDESFTHMRLLKFCFNSVNMPGTDNEHVMELHLRRIVQGSMHFCMEAREPTAYLTLLRTLFRSIGGGAHDKLYREFFPLLPEMLTTLNRLLRSAHRTFARDLLGELCVIVPVRLSTLLPYLTLLMEPLIYVLNCNTVNQGLRTLELCVDNMQPDFLYEHFYEVRGDMLLALYNSLHSPSEYVQKMAFKVLGKLGRYNRTDLPEIQRLNLNATNGRSGPILRFWLNEFPNHPVDLPIRTLVDAAIESIQNAGMDLPSRLRSWQFLRGICISSINLFAYQRGDESDFPVGAFMDGLPVYPLQTLASLLASPALIEDFHATPSLHHLVMVRAIGGLFLGAAVPSIAEKCGDFITFLTRHLTFLGLLHQPASCFHDIDDPCPSPLLAIKREHDPLTPSTRLEATLDPRLLVDAVCFVMGHEDKQLVHAGYILLDEIVFTATAAIDAALELEHPGANETRNRSSAELLIHLPLMHYLAKATTDMLYHPTWYVKWGGCCTLLHLLNRLPVSWFRDHYMPFVRGLKHCLHDLTGQMGQGALSLARECTTSITRAVFTAEAPKLLSKEDAGEPSKSSSSSPPLPPAMQTSTPEQATAPRKPVSSQRGRRGVATAKRGGGGGAIKRKFRAESSSAEDVEMADVPTPTLAASRPMLCDDAFAPLLRTPLMLVVLPELTESLMSHAKAVREQAREMLTIIAESHSVSLSVLLKPHLHLIQCWLPPKNRVNRLINLPVSAQIAVIEINNLFCRDAGQIRYCPSTRRCDSRFLADLRTVMDAPMPPSVTALASSVSAPSTTFGGGAVAARALQQSAVAGQSSIGQQTLLSSLQLQQAIDLKVGACRILATLHYLEAQKSTTLAALFKGMCTDCPSVHKAAFVCAQEFTKKTTIEMELRTTYVKPILQNIRQTSNMRIATVRQLTYCAELFPSTFSERFCETIQNILTNVANSSVNCDLIAALVDLFHLIPLAGAKYVKILLNLVFRVEQCLNNEQTSPLRVPLVRFLNRYPEETFKQLLGGRFPNSSDGSSHRLTQDLLNLPESKPLVDYLIANSCILTGLLKLCDDESGEFTCQLTPFRLPLSRGPLTSAYPSSAHLALRIIHSLNNLRPDWLPSNEAVLQTLFGVWSSATFFQRHSCLTLVQLQKLQPDVDLDLLLESASGEETHWKPFSDASNNQALAGIRVIAGLTDYTHWDEPSLILECLLACAQARPNDTDLLFAIVGGMARLRCVGYNPLPKFIHRLVQDSSVAWHRQLFLAFVQLVRSRTRNQSLSEIPQVTSSNDTLPLSRYLNSAEAHYRILSQLVLSCAQHSLERSPDEFVLPGKAANAEEENENDVVHLFVTILLNDEAAKRCTGLRIMYYQLASLFLYFAPDHVQTRDDKQQQSYRLKAIINYAWPCVLSNLNVVDLQEKYTGLDVLAHVISRFFEQFFAKKPATLMQVFLCLAKGTQTEVKKIVNPALDLLLPAWVTGPEEQNALAVATRKIMTEDHGTQSCIHILNLIVRHSDLYYPVRHHLLNLLIVIISRLSTQQLPVDQRRLILDMIETIIHWDKRCKTEKTSHVKAEPKDIESGLQKTPTIAMDPLNVPMEKSLRDQLLNLMVRFACQSIDTSQNGSNSEASARKALGQLEAAFSSECWGGETCDLRLGFLDRLLLCAEDSAAVGGSAVAVQQQQQQQQNQQLSMAALQASGVFMTLEVLRIIYSTLESPTLLLNVKHFAKPLANLLNRFPMNLRLVRACANLVKALLVKFPGDSSSRQKIVSTPELQEIYDAVLKFIQDSFTLYAESATKTTLLPRLQCAFCLLTTTQTVPTNPHVFVDRCVPQLAKVLHRLIPDVVGSNTTGSLQDNTTSSQLIELLIQGLELFKARLNVVSTETRKNTFGADLFLILERAKDAKLFRAVVRILRDWVHTPKAEEHFAPTTREMVAFFVRLWAAYPRWNDQPSVAREIFECIFQVFANVSPKNYEIFTKMEQAFCCGLLSPLPDIREKFMNLFLTGSDLTHNDLFPANEETVTDENVAPMEADGGMNKKATLPTPAPTTRQPKSSLLVRLMFLLISNPWDEAHFKDGFWLPVFFDVVLCDADFARPSLMAQPAARFASYGDHVENEEPGVPPSPVKRDIFDTSDLELSKKRSPNGEVAPSTIAGGGRGDGDKPETQKIEREKPAFDRLLEQQASAFEDLKTLTFRETLRGLLNLVHRRQALATELFGQLWHCLWHRLFLRHSALPPAAFDPSISQLTDSLAETSIFSAAAEQLLACASPPKSSHPGGRSSPANGMSPADIRGFLVPPWNKFITSDDHVNPNEGVLSPLGSTVAALTTTPDSLLLSLPLPVLSYIGYTHSQWHTMALFFESLCARGQRALQFNNRNCSVDNDLAHTLVPAIDGSGAASGLPEDVPLGVAALSLVALYDAMAEPDHFVSAWWHRLSSNCAGSQRLAHAASSGAAIRWPLEQSCDYLSALSAFSQGRLTRGLETAMNILGRPMPEDATGFIGVDGGVTEESGRSMRFSEQINRNKLHEYSLRTLKQMGQWDNLELLASAVNPSPGGSSVSSLGGGASPLGNSFGSPFWALRAEAAWRHRDWSEVFTCLAGLANEVPRHEQWRYALIQASACIAGRRSVDFEGALPSAASGTAASANLGGSVSGGDGGGGVSTTSTPGSGSTGPTSGGDCVGGGGSSGASVLPNLMQISEVECHRAMQCILREWKRIPLIIDRQHIRLLQACQQATEIGEGNVLIIQHCVPPIGFSGGGGGGSGRASASLNQSIYDYKGRPPLVSDDLCFWNDLLSWRQVVHEKIIKNSTFTHKFSQERTNLFAMCHRERAMSLIHMARGYRKNGLINLAQQQLDSSLPSLFEKTKQEIKLKIIDLRKEELLEGLELMEKTNIQQFEKKDKAKFFCYKAVFFSHFNKGDEATKNFGYATQMQDNSHKVWSVFGDFLESVYSSNRTAKRETGVSTTGIFAMQALMEAATVAGTSQHLSHADLAKCIWLLTLDDPCDTPTGLGGAGATSGVITSSASPPTSLTSGTSATSAAIGGGGGGVSQVQRLAKTFEERASRIHPDAFLPWIPSLATCLLRPEGRFVSTSLRSIALAYPNVLAAVLRPLQHQLAVEVERDNRIAVALAELTPNQRQELDGYYAYCVDPATRRKSSFGVSTPMASTGTSLDHQQGSSQQQHSSIGTSKKRVVVVMRGAEGEKLGEANGSLSSTSGGGGGVGGGIRDCHVMGELQDMEIDEEEGGVGVGSGPNTPTIPSGEDDDEEGAILLPRTGYMSTAVVEGLHRVNLLFSQLRQRHPARIYVLERFVENIGGRLLPGWAENVLHHLQTALSQLHELAWAQVSRFVRRPATYPSATTLRNLIALPLPSWMAKELLTIAMCCGLPDGSSLTVPEDDDESDCRTTSSPAYSDVMQLACRTLTLEAEADPYFKPIKQRLVARLEGVASEPLLQVIHSLTHEVIPFVERRVANLPRTSYIADRGAAILIETITAASNQCAHGHHLRISPASTSVFPVPLELPGEAVRMKTIPTLHQHPSTSGSGASGSGSGGVQSHMHQLFSTENQQPHVLYLADILPCVVRSRAGRRLAMRANNGRLFHYDVGHLPRELPAGRAVSIGSADATEASSLAPTLAAYVAWRESWCPPHLFQVLNDLAAKHPETSKRRLHLVAPNTMDVGPCGLRLTQVGCAAPAGTVVTASSVAFGHNAIVTGQGGSLLTQQLHTAVTGAFLSPSEPSSLVPPKSTPAYAASFPAANPLASCNKPQQQQHSSEKPPPIVNTCSSAGGYAGSRGVANDVMGQPAGAEMGCHAASVSLADIADSADSQSPPIGATGPFSSRNLIHTFFDQLCHLAVVAESKPTNLKGCLVEIFDNLLNLVPRTQHLEDASHLALGVLSDECTATTPGSLVRNWAFRQFVDAESYWLFRNGVALQGGTLALTETLFSMTQLSATDLLLDPRVGRVETRRLRFDLPSTPSLLTVSQQKESRPVELSSKSAIALASIFASTFAPIKAPVGGAGGSGSSRPATLGVAAHPASTIILPSRPAPFRLTPQMTGLMCLPGVPATIGPFAAAMATLNQAVAQHRPGLLASLRTLLRDDFIMWHRGRQAAVHASLLADLLTLQGTTEAEEAGEMGTAAFGTPNPIQVCDLTNDSLVRLISHSSEGFMYRSRALAGSEKVLGDLINAACSPENLACMDPSWLPWI